MVKNLSQLKRTLRKGAQFRIVVHGRPECVGEQREVTYANSQGFYSIVPGNYILYDAAHAIHGLLQVAGS